MIPGNDMADLLLAADQDVPIRGDFDIPGDFRTGLALAADLGVLLADHAGDAVQKDLQRHAAHLILRHRELRAGLDGCRAAPGKGAQLGSLGHAEGVRQHTDFVTFGILDDVRHRTPSLPLDGGLLEHDAVGIHIRGDLAAILDDGHHATGIVRFAVDGHGVAAGGDTVEDVGVGVLVFFGHGVTDVGHLEGAVLGHGAGRAVERHQVAVRGAFRAFDGAHHVVLDHGPVGQQPPPRRRP
nr:MAG TPA: hypothetical protein [Caudoviricetes sp.]